MGVYGKLQSGIWSKDVDDHFTAIIDFGDDAIYQMEASNNCRVPHPRWYIVGDKGTMSMISRLTNVWDEAEINYVKKNGTRESKKIKIEGSPAGCTGGFYKDFVKYLKGGKKEFLSMHMSSLGMKIIDAIKESDSKKRYISI
jgi:predicted dehydrogenase